MNISLNHIGKQKDGSSTTIELSITTSTLNIKEELTNFDGSIDKSIIDQLEQVLEELKEQNSIVG